MKIKTLEQFNQELESLPEEVAPKYWLIGDREKERKSRKIHEKYYKLRGEAIKKREEWIREHFRKVTLDSVLDNFDFGKKFIEVGCTDFTVTDNVISIKHIQDKEYLMIIRNPRGFEDCSDLMSIFKHQDGGEPVLIFEPYEFLGSFESSEIRRRYIKLWSGANVCMGDFNIRLPPHYRTSDIPYRFKNKQTVPN